jgi:large subunit ribosomal protein L12
MEYVYAAMLLHSAGKKITEDSISKILKASGVEVNEARAKALVAALEDINIEEAIKTAAAVHAAAPATAPAAEAAKPEAAPAEEEEEEEPTEEEALAGLGSLFG